MSINTIVIVGNLTKDMELKYTSSGTAIGKFSIAVNEREKKGDTWETVASFFNVTIFGKMAESLRQYLVKGKQIGVEGSLKQNRWEGDNGPRSEVVIIADNIQLLGGKHRE